MTFLDVDVNRAIWNILHVSLIIPCPIFFLRVAVEFIIPNKRQIFTCIFTCINSCEFHFHFVSPLKSIELTIFYSHMISHSKKFQVQFLEKKDF